MELKTGPMLAVTTIHDRSGKRVGSHLVDKSKDAPNRQKKQQEQQPDPQRADEAVVFYSSEATNKDAAGQDEKNASNQHSTLNLTV